MFLGQESIRKFFGERETVYYWTFTFAEVVSDKAEAERRWKPFVDLVKRRGGQHLEFWELQTRGCWHVHCLIDVYLDATWLRGTRAEPGWMVRRGWGCMMRVERIQSKRVWLDGHGWTRDDRKEAWLIRYLTKYLTKCARASAGKKKCFTASVQAKAGTTRFKWVPWVKPGAYLFAMGLSLFAQLEGRPAGFADVRACILYGIEETDWLSHDPWFHECGGCSGGQRKASGKKLSAQNAFSWVVPRV